MTSDDAKDPPVPADLEGAPRRIHRDEVARDHDAHDHAVSVDEPNG